jgi:hypothetical protein
MNLFWPAKQRAPEVAPKQARRMNRFLGVYAGAFRVASMQARMDQSMC